MKITEREEILMRRALDPASSPAEAEMAAQVFVRSLRKRGVSGYELRAQALLRPARARSSGLAIRRRQSPSRNHSQKRGLINRTPITGAIRTLAKQRKIPNGISCVSNEPALSEKLPKIRRHQHHGPSRRPKRKKAAMLGAGFRH